MELNQPARLLDRINATCEAFESAWQSGSRPKIREFLVGWDGSERRELFRYLMDLDREFVRQVGETPNRNFYVGEFPEFAHEINEAFGVEQQDPGSSVQMGYDETYRRPEKNTPDLADDPLLAVGRLGRYEISKILGVGGMGVVYLANDPDLERQVAVKVPRFPEDENETMLRRFLREGRSAAKLNHPNICPIHDVGVAGATHYITMAYIEGGKLSETIDKSGNADQGQVAKTIRTLALAMQEAHNQGVIHRDLKPSNVMLTSAGEPMLMDFGLAREEQPDGSQLTIAGSLVGTPAYMSPEQVRSELDKIGPPSDIYSLGVVLYQMLTGRLPFEGDLLTMLMAIADDNPVSPRTHRRDLDQRLNQLCLQMLAKLPSDRPTSMQAVADTLERIIASPAPVTNAPQADPHATTIVPVDFSSIETASKPKPKPKATKQPSSTKKWLWPAALLGGALLVAGIIIYAKIGDRDVRVTMDDDATSIRSKGNSLVIDGQGNRIEISEGDDEKLIVRRDGLVVETDKVSIERDGKETLRVETVDGRIAVLKADRVPQKPPRPPKPATKPTSEPTDKIESAKTVEPMPAKVEETKPESKPVIKPEPKPVVVVAPKKEPFRMPEKEVVLREGEYSVELLNMMRVHTSWPQGLAYSPDGKMLASCGLDNRIVIYDADTGEVMKQFRDFGSSVKDVAFSPDSRFLVATGRPMRVAVYDCESGEMIRSLPEEVPAEKVVDNRVHGNIGVAYSPAGDLIANGDTKNRIILWDSMSGEKLATLTDHTKHVWAIEFSSDGKLFATTSWDGTTRIWNSETREPLHVLDSPDSVVYGVAFSKDNSKIYTAGNGCQIVEWNVMTGERIRNIGDRKSMIISISVSADGSRIITGCRAELYIDDTTTGKTLLKVPVGKDSVHAEFSTTDPNRFAVTTNDNGPDNSVRLFQLKVSMPEPE